MRKLNNIKNKAIAAGAVVGSALVASPAFAQAATDASATQTTLLGYVTSYGGMAAAVIAAGTGFAILFSMTRKAKA